MKNKKILFSFLAFLIITIMIMGYATALVRENNAQLQGYVDERVDNIAEQIKQSEQANKQLYKAMTDNRTFYFQTTGNPFEIAESYVDSGKLIIERIELLDE